MEPRFLSPEANLEITLVITRTIEGETQKINVLRASSPPFARVSLGKTTEFNKLGLGRCLPGSHVFTMSGMTWSQTPGKLHRLANLHRFCVDFRLSYSKLHSK
jgi:hypothetical protein